MGRYLIPVLVIVCTAVLPAADPVISVPAADQVVVAYRDLPVLVTLAHVEVPPDGREACRARLEELVTDQEVQVIYKPSFGVDDRGTGRVHIKAGGDHVNGILVAEGLARYHEIEGDDSTYGRLLAMNQRRAKEDEKGLWGRVQVAAVTPEQPDEPTEEPGGPTGRERAATPAKPKGPYAAELTGSLYYASDDPRVARLNQGSLIYYRSEAAARRAGKRKAPAPAAASTGSGGEADADRLLAEGKELYSNAIAAGNTTRRDDLYGESFTKFTAAMRIYSRLVEAAPNDAGLAEKLRETMKLRYGAMKQRRF